ncbi:inositol-pentakisphosphate 2-kinase [Lepeophtheirus salmonis]|uniref:inositol-pentakisphosphate 2-kinase n=1 Tax=Lepeophtheirus salmonis TaxID=72036 RepID=UPI001AE10F4A|nr:inositol-pentakisphosphate 2-kinase-like [Lepeophtheirus salmonis]XP_040568205.1 inositol-pentakisphosphate 2-kinase-like [Lepeophtheirus salmonis]
MSKFNINKSHNLQVPCGSCSLSYCWISMQSLHFPCLPRIVLPPDGWYYRGEGNANLVISLVSSRSVLRFRKSKYYDKDHDSDTLEIIQYVNKIMRPLLGEQFVRSLYVAYLSTEDVEEVKTRIQPFRPLKRIKKDVKGTIVIVSPDCTYLTPEYERNTIGDTLSVEIKPKEGWHSTKLFYSSDLCHRCLKYHAKTNKNEISNISPYCPLDLFSGIPSRSKRALYDLYDYSHGRFKVFKNGKVLYNEESKSPEIMEEELKDFFGHERSEKDVRNYLCSLLISSLLGFDSCDEFINLIPWERSHKLKCDDSHVPLPEGSVLNALLSIQKYPILSDRKAKYISDKFLCTTDDLDEMNKFVHLFNPERYRYVPKTGFVHDVEQLQKYLMSITARDVSIFLTFRKIKDMDEETQFQEMTASSSLCNCKRPPYSTIIHLKDQTYRVMISVIDLDPKPIHRISKWVQDKEEWIKSVESSQS